MNSKIIFVNEKIKKEFFKLEKSKVFERELHSQITKAFEKLEQNAFCGIQIPKKQIPKEYQVNNLWKFNLPNGWRLIYTVKNNQIIILSIILEWMSHKEYERKFKY